MIAFPASLARKQGHVSSSDTATPNLNQELVTQRSRGHRECILVAKWEQQQAC